MIYCGTSIDCEVVSSYPGSGTGDTIYVTSTGRRVLGSCSNLPPGHYWKPRNTANTSCIYTSNNTKSQKEIELEKLLKELAEWYKAERNRTWIKPFHDPPVYKPRFRRVQMLTKPENRARSHPIHVRNIRWDPRERA